ncbi:glycerol-3-phosphate dehydrogenase/oxidase [Allorhizobium sp. BGMRC 0089]|uniref:glycerol-3-phosphate dehydrogenase/oxidase n=1 Tax=Allorhizobium sonneratiae TaxID=2934936 RepID=UPI002033AC3F|nr:glycerol-3-phosphate dehydrogenase/oxidase [Allorhizobium sonneratiae]MCM2293256.1 glycerol-3-phosphate dehydrogenase/oxidase [Allorhizobium sonneratiae]
MIDTLSQQTRPVDVVILGAGINGAGLFRDLCEQGVTCVLIDKADFAAGTSAAPSRLIHGGLKYLETGEFSLVAQSTLERNLLLKNAPHCVEPLPTFLPVFSVLRGIPAALRTLFGSTTAPRSRGALLVKLGLWLYDVYGARHRVMPRHRFLSKKAARQRIPALTERIVAGGIYYDAKISRPERLVYELVTDGLAAHPGSAALTYTDLVDCDQGRLMFRLANGQTLALLPQLVVNAAGAWIDRVNEKLGAPSKLIGGTKGSHILLDHPELLKQLDGHMIYFEADDGRICLVYDYLGLALVGSTDIPADDPESVRCEAEETRYFLESLRSLLPGLSFSEDQIVYSYSGIRPLPASNADNPGLISRDHSAPVIEPQGARRFPIISLVGGKWTTFRGFAEEVADMALTRLGRSRLKSTEALPIGGGRDFPKTPEAREAWIAQTIQRFRISQSRAEQLLARYGTTAAMVLAFVSVHSDGTRLAGMPDWSAREIDWIVRCESVVHLADLVMRRTSMAIDGSLTRAGLDDMASIAAEALSWSETEKAREVEALLQHLRAFHSIRL